METCSLFQDLAYSLEIAAHDAGLEHYYLRMYFDAVSGNQRYVECFVPEEWLPPHGVRAEIEVELEPLDIARSQLSDGEIIDALGAIPGDEAEALPLDAHLEIKFFLSLDTLLLQSEGGTAYRRKVTEQDRLQAGLESFQYKLHHAIEEEDAPALRVEAHSALIPSGYLVLDKIVGYWPVAVGMDIEDDIRQEILEDILNRVRAGLEALQDFAHDIQADVAANPG
jgi:hypothetical protein